MLHNINYDFLVNSDDEKLLTKTQTKEKARDFNLTVVLEEWTSEKIIQRSSVCEIPVWSKVNLSMKLSALPIYPTYNDWLDNYICYNVVKFVRPRSNRGIWPKRIVAKPKALQSRCPGCRTPLSRAGWRRCGRPWPRRRGGNTCRLAVTGRLGQDS